MLQIAISAAMIAVGLALLIYAANILVKGSSSIAKRAGLSAFFIGMTIVAFGTSLPELIVNLFASFKGSNDIAIGNILGSNIANILLIAGISAVIFPLSVRKATVFKEIPFALLAVVALFVMANDQFFDARTIDSMSRGDGLVLIMFFAIFMYYMISISKGGTEEGAEAEITLYSFPLALLMVIGGIVGLTIGGNLMVQGAIDFATLLGLSESLIGLTVVAVGTSLPELATSAMAAWRKNSDIAIGNIVGSNIFNIFWILGVSAFIYPLNFSADLNIDVIVTMLTTILLFVMMFLGRRHLLERWQGATMVLLYVTYVAYLVIRDIS